MIPRPELSLTPGLVAHGRRQSEPTEDRRGRIAYLESHGERGDVWLHEPKTGWPRQVTTDPHPRAAGSYAGGTLCWVPDGTGIVFVAEDRQLWLTPDVGGPSRRLTDLPGRCTAPAVDPSGDLLAFVYETPDRTDVVTAAVGSGALSEDDLTVLNRSDFAFDPEWSPDGRLLAWHEWDVPAMPWDAGVIAVGGADGSGRRVVDGGDYGVAQPRFSPDGRWLAYLSERTGWLNLWMADTATWTPRQLVDEESEHGSPAWRPRVRSFAWSPQADRLLFVRNRGGRETLGEIVVDGGAVRGVAGLEGVLEDLTWGSRPLLVAGSSVVPRALVAFDEEDGAEVLADDGLAAWGGMPLVPAEAVTFPSSDGAEVHGLLWRPTGDPRSPLLLHCHGGPNGQVRDGWNPAFQYWVSRGHPVLAVNHRGSTGYGREYREALGGRWGELDVADAAAAARWAVDQGLAEPGGVVPWGGSAGGYLVLMLLARHPELFAGGVELYGVVDLERLAASTHRFEAHYLDRLVGPLPEAAERYRARSPLHLVDRIERPLLVLQGEEDEVVPPEQSKLLYEHLLSKDLEVELVLYPDEGHGFTRASTLLDVLSRMERFLDRVSERATASTA